MRKRSPPSLLATLWSRLRKDRDPAPVSASAVRPFQAISIFRGAKSCVMAQRFSDHRFLAKDAPTLPLIGCTIPDTCECCYLRHKDRRSERRRLVDFTALRTGNKSGAGRERRALPGRRKTD